MKHKNRRGGPSYFAVEFCCVPGRFIGENVAFIRDVVDYFSSFGAPAAFISLDQEKSFDRVDWSFRRSVLIFLGFGTSFVKWVDLFYCNSRSSVNVNGHISNSFSVSWCPAGLPIVSASIRLSC